MTVPAKLLSLVYSAATNNSLWAEFCAELHRVTGAMVQMVGHSTRNYESLGLIGAGIEPGLLDDYHKHFAPLNPWMHMNLAMQVGDVGISDQGLPRAELLRTEFYNDWLRPQDNIVAGMAMIGYRSKERFTALIAGCRARRIDDSLPETHQLLVELSPHVTQSISIARTLRNGDDTGMRHLDASPHAIYMIRRSGRTGYMNPAAERLAKEGGTISIGHDGRLAASDPDTRQHIGDAVLAMQMRNFSSVIRPKAIETRSFGPCILHAHFFPEDSECGFPELIWNDPIIGAFVVTGSAGLNDGPPDTTIVRALGATPAEAKLATAVLSGCSLYDYADANQVSRHTVRNQMRSLLHKTGTRNQADFVRLVHRLASPFVAFDG